MAEVAEVGNEAWGLFCLIGAWCASESTGGVIPVIGARRFGSRQALGKLLQAGFLAKEDSQNYRMVDSTHWKVVVADDNRVRVQWNLIRDTVRDSIFIRDGKYCAYCGSTENLTIDHIVPISRGGTNHEYNLTPACTSCNASKGDKLESEWEKP